MRNQVTKPAKPSVLSDISNSAFECRNMVWQKLQIDIGEKVVIQIGRWSAETMIALVRSIASKNRIKIDVKDRGSYLSVERLPDSGRRSRYRFDDIPEDGSKFFEVPDDRLTSFRCLAAKYARMNSWKVSCRAEPGGIRVYRAGEKPLPNRFENRRTKRGEKITQLEARRIEFTLVEGRYSHLFSKLEQPGDFFVAPASFINPSAGTDRDVSNAIQKMNNRIRAMAHVFSKRHGTTFAIYVRGREGVAVMRTA